MFSYIELKKNKKTTFTVNHYNYQKLVGIKSNKQSFLSESIFVVSVV